MGQVSPAGENINYNSSTKEIVWSADRIAKGAGVTGVSRTVSFQVSLSPSLSQVGTTPVIINSATLTGHDDFANVDVKVGKPSLNTRLDSDLAFPPTGANVVQ